MTTEERLDKVERELAASKKRNHWLIIIASLAALACIIIAALSLRTPKEICARKIKVVDEKGQLKACLGGTTNGATLELFGASGITATIDVDSRHGFISMCRGDYKGYCLSVGNIGSQVDTVLLLNNGRIQMHNDHPEQECIVISDTNELPKIARFPIFHEYNREQTSVENKIPIQNESDPAVPLKKYMEALAMQRVDEMLKYVVPGQEKYRAIIAKAAEGQAHPEYEFKESQRIVSGSVAKIWHNTPSGGSYKSVVVKEDGVWKVNFELSFAESNRD